MKLLVTILLVAVSKPAYSQLPWYICEDCLILEVKNRKPTTCTDLQTSEPQGTSSNDSYLIQNIFRRQAVELQLRTGEILTDGDRIKVNRGCIEYTMSDTTICNLVSSETPISCNLCDENECNTLVRVESWLVPIRVVASTLIVSRLLWI